MTQVLNLVLPADAKYRRMGTDVASKFTEICGGSSADAEALAAAFTKALDEVSAGANGMDAIQAALRNDGATVEISLTCGSRSAVVRQPVPARNS